MIRISRFALLLLLISGTAISSNLTQQSVEKATEVITAAVEAYGGQDRLHGLNTLIIEHETINVAVNQSRKPEPPWDRNTSSGISAVDFEHEVFYTRNSGSGGGFENDNATLINGDDSFQFNFRANTAAPVAQPDFDNASGPFMRVTPALLVKLASERVHTAHYLGSTTIDGNAHDVITFAMEVGPAISLYFDQASHLLNKSERMFVPFGLVEYRFTDYESIDGIPFNKTFNLFVNGDNNMIRTNHITRVNSPLESFTSVPEDLSHIPAIEPDPLTRQQIADGVYLIGGSGTYALFIDMQDYVIAVGGTAGIPDRIASLREVVGDKPVRYGILTHHHSDHVLGVAAYAAEGATVVAAQAHAGVVREAAGDEPLKLETVSERRVIRSGDREVHIIDVGPTAHTEHLLVTYLPDEGIIFEADHFSMPRSGPVPPAVTTTRNFANGLKANGIEPRIIASAHSPRTGSMADLEEAIRKARQLTSMR